MKRYTATFLAAILIISLFISPAYAAPSKEVSFDPKTDVTVNGRMKLAKAEEYLALSIQNLTFFKENGKLYVKGNQPVLPEGFEVRLHISVTYLIDSKTPLGAFLLSTHYEKASADLFDAVIDAAMEVQDNE